MCTRFSAIFFGDSLSKYRKMPTGKEKKRTPSKLRSLVCNKAENGVCCDEPTLIATLQVELFFNVLVVVSLRPENRGSRRAITRDGRPAPRGTLPAGKGGFPAPTRPVKMIKTAGKLRGKIKARISTFPIEETNDGTILQH